LHFKIHLPNVREELFFVNTYPKVSFHKVLEGKLQRLSYLVRSMYKKIMLNCQTFKLKAYP
jgi:hypothetical protein